MLTSNGKALLKINSSYQRLTQGSVYKGTAGTNITLGGDSELNYILNSLVLVFGEGTTEPTPDDYCLEDAIDTLSVVVSTNTANTDKPNYSQNYILICQATVKNNTEEDITISEIGIQGTDTGKGDVLITRDTFKPITIAPQKTYTVSVTIG